MCHAVRNTSGTLAASTKPSESGIGITFTRVTAISSQLPPSTALPNTANCWQKFCRPSLHCSQWLQKTIGASSTRMPGLRSVMYSPHSTTSPAISLPRMCGRLHTRQTSAHPQVKMVQRTGAHADQNLVLAQDGIGGVFVFENFRAAELMNANRFHRLVPR